MPPKRRKNNDLNTVDDLIMNRNTITAKISRFEEYLQNLNQDSNITELRLRLTRFEELWETFDSIQTQIESIQTGQSEVQRDIRKHFEDKYFRLASEAEDYIQAHRSAAIASNNATREIETSTAPHYMQNQPQIRLPVIELPSFNGAYDQWTQFYNTFSSLIHNNRNLSQIEKFQYLKSSVKGDAISTIESLSLTSENYEVAWRLLQERYENKRLIVHNHVNALLDLPAVTKESAVALRQLCDNFLKHIRALEALQQPIQSWDAFIIPLLSSKFDNLTKREWEAAQLSNDLPTLSQIIEFLKKRCRVLEAVQSKGETKSSANAKPQKLTSHVTTENPKKSCPHCQEEHQIYNCSKFLKLPVNERWHAVKKMKICTNCLKRNHFNKDCNSTSCKTCNKRHNSLLHYNEATKYKHNEVSDNQPTPEKVETVTTACANASSAHVLLSTAIVHVFDSAGHTHECRALLDSGSQSHYITDNLCRKLKLKRHNTQFSVSGIGEVATQISQCTQVKFKSRYNGFHATINCLILESITNKIPNTKLNTTNLDIPTNIKLADHTYNTPGNIDLLIGAELFFQLMCNGQIQLGSKRPTIQKTQLGWIISGSIYIDEHIQPQKTRCHLNINQNLENQIVKFWNLEEIQNKTHYSPQEEKCELHFMNNTTRDSTGRYCVRLPVNEDAPALGNSYETALKRFQYLENRLEKNPELKQEYAKFMREYQDLQHMTFVDTKHDQTEITYYLPHHAVVKESSSTTKVRVVFDGSSKTSNNVSLNDTLLVGPNIQDDLFSIIIRFRSYQYVLTADIEKMYRQVNVHTEDRNLQRIIWRENPSQPISIYTLNTVTYGISSAAFLAVRALKQLALDEGDSYPKAAKVLLTSFYVDDCLTGASSVKEARELKQELTTLLAKGQFNLRKWKSNALEILYESNIKGDSSLSLSFNDDETCKTLGLYWNPVQDSLQYSITVKQTNKVTKRCILSLIAQIFDPLGLLGPIITTAKLIMQQLWQLKVEWDESLPINIHTKWNRYYSSLNQLNDLQINRKVIPTSQSSCIQLHGFCDASEAAFGASIYLRTSDRDGVSHTALICSKSRVAPLKSISIPRLELCAALLLSQLSKKVQEAMHLKFDQIYHWTDSTIVLHWIDTSPYLLKQFVANRVCQIQELSHEVNWKHVRSEENPADLLSRGTDPATLAQKTIWWIGPTWLEHDESHWPTLEINSDHTSDVLEIRKTTLASTTQDYSILCRYSSFTKLKRIIAWCYRFKYNTLHNENKKQGPLMVDELRNAEVILLRLLQQQCFKEEIKDLKQEQHVDRRSKLVNLTPFLCKQDLIRVGGRLKYAHIPYNQRHPIILPAKHVLTEAIIRDEHIARLHCGSQSLLAFIRLKYWPLSAKNTVRKITRNCILCFRCNPTPAEHTMGNIPEPRIRPGNRPFAISGVDYCGPFNIIETRGRVHIEPVTQLTAEAFLATLRRFTARRGLCSDLYSDNATNFTRANHDLQDLFDLLQKEENSIKNELAKQQIKWHFIPPRSPHFGGLWEAAVKSLKYHLKRIYSLNLTFEEMYTIVTQIEAILNSRPLIPMSTDPNDLNFLTPAHFLIGDSLIAPLEEDVTNIKESLLNRWQHVQRMKQHFWKRWSRDYLHQLQERSKWVQHSSNPEIGSLVLLTDENSPPLRWAVGRITALHPGEDKVVRVVTVQTNTGVFKRAIRKICVLPISGDRK